VPDRGSDGGDQADREEAQNRAAQKIPLPDDSCTTRRSRLVRLIDQLLNIPSFSGTRVIFTRRVLGP
jgi:hypothetical protein